MHTSNINPTSLFLMGKFIFLFFTSRMKADIFKVILSFIVWGSSNNTVFWDPEKTVLKYGSEEKGSSLYRCSILLGFIMSKKQERLRSELLSEDKITNLLGFLT